MSYDLPRFIELCRKSATQHSAGSGNLVSVVALAQERFIQLFVDPVGSEDVNFVALEPEEAFAIGAALRRASAHPVVIECGRWAFTVSQVGTETKVEAVRRDPLMRESFALQFTPEVAQDFANDLDDAGRTWVPATKH